MFNKTDIKRDECQLVGGFGKQGYDWWWHSFTAYNKKTGQAELSPIKWTHKALK